MMEAGDIRRLLAPLARKVQLMLARAIVTLVDDAAELQLIQAQLDKGDLQSGMQSFRQYGFGSVPLAGAEAIFAAPGGLCSAGVVIATEDRRYRPKNWAPGWSGLYDASGTTVILENDGTIVITAATKIRIVTPRLEVTGDVIDQCDAQPNTVRDMRAIYDGHTHGGVQGGIGDSAAPNQAM